MIQHRISWHFVRYLVHWMHADGFGGCLLFVQLGTYASVFIFEFPVTKATVNCCSTKKLCKPQTVPGGLLGQRPADLINCHGGFHTTELWVEYSCCRLFVFFFSPHHANTFWDMKILAHFVEQHFFTCTHVWVTQGNICCALTCLLGILKYSNC